MKEIFEAFIGIFFLTLLSITSVSVISASIDNSNANTYHTAIVTEFEESNFSPSVISALGNAAANEGYELDLTLFRESGTPTVLRFDETSRPAVGDTSDVYLAEVNLTFDFTFSFVEAVTPHTIKGFAR